MRLRSRSSSNCRQGFLLPAALILGVVILGLALVYEFAARTQNRRGHRYRGTLVARYMSRAAVFLVRHLVRDAADPRQIPGSAPQPTRDFRSLVMSPPSRLERAVEEVRGGDDDRVLLRNLFGGDATDLLDQLEESMDGASLTIHVDIEPTAFPGAPEWYADTVSKGVVVTIRAIAQAGGVERRASGTESVVVYPLISPVLGRFPGNTGLQWNESGRAFPAEPFDLARPDLPLLGEQTVTQGKVQETFADRGWAYPRHQVVDPGGGPWGLHHLLWLPESGKVPVPRSLLFEEPPGPFEGDFPDPFHPGQMQRPLVEGLVLGVSGPPTEAVPGVDYPFSSAPLAASYYDDPTVYPPLPSSTGIGGPFGTTLDPSPTYAPGTRLRVYAFGAVTVDRDDRPDDEGAQRASVGFDLPFRETVGYYLPQAPDSAGEYAQAVQDPNGPLPRLPEAPPGSGFSTLPNLNHQVDSDGDGTLDTYVYSEAAYPTIVHTRALFDAVELFPEYGDYLPHASRTVDLPAHLAFELSTLPVQEAQERLHELAWDPAKLRAAEDWEELPHGLSHRDPLHALGTEPDDELHWGVLDSEAAAAGDASRFLGELPEIALYAPRRWMPTAYVYGQPGLEKFFPDGDLRGVRVIVVPDTEDGPSSVRLEGPLRGGVLAAGLVEEVDQIPAQPVHSPLEVMARYAVVGAHGGSHLLVHTSVDGLHPVGPADEALAKLRGGAFVGVNMPILGPTGPEPELEKALQAALQGKQPKPLGVVWDETHDPIGARANQAYRVAWVGLR